MLRLFIAALAGLILGVALSATMLDNGVDAAISLQCGMSLVALVCVFGLYWATRAAKDRRPRPSSRPAPMTAGGGKVLVLRHSVRFHDIHVGLWYPGRVVFSMN